MHIQINYGDGTVETIPVTLQGNRVSSGRSWIPGHSVGEPSRRAYMRADFFECAIDEGKERSGRFHPDEDDLGGPPQETFYWRLVGDEGEECKLKLAAWRAEIGETFDPTLPASEQSVLAPDRHQAYEDDRQCWEFYLDDATVELMALASTPRL